MVRRRPITSYALVGLILAVSAVPAACSDTDPLDVTGSAAKGSDASAGAGVAGIATTTAVPGTDGAGAPATEVTEPPETLPPDPPSGALDWDGVKFDWGEIESTTQQGGRVVINFDRWQWDGVDAPAMTEERIVFGNTDFGGTNDSPKLRSYVLALDVDLLEITNERDTSPACNDAGRADPPKWSHFAVTGLQNADPSLKSTQTSLTFSPVGEVTRIRISRGC